MLNTVLVKEFYEKLQTIFSFRKKMGILFYMLGLVFVAGLGGCGNEGYTWGWYVITPWHPIGLTNIQFLLSGLGYTILLSISAIILSILLGLIVTLPALMNNIIARRINRVYVEIFRSIPVLVMLLWVYYGLPPALGIRLEVFSAGILGLALCDSAFEAEIFRAGIQSIGRGQHDAADSLGLNYWKKMRLVILPQAIRVVLPAIGNQFENVLAGIRDRLDRTHPQSRRTGCEYVSPTGNIYLPCSGVFRADPLHLLCNALDGESSSICRVLNMLSVLLLLFQKTDDIFRFLKRIKFKYKYYFVLT